jgi:hypothetical protein
VRVAIFLTSLGVGCACAVATSCSTATCEESETCARFCPQPDAAYCEDFDTPDAGALVTSSNGDAKIFVASDDGPSSPNALEIVIPRITAGGTAYGQYSRDAGVVASFHLAFAMRVESTAPGGGVTVFSIGVPNAQLYLSVHTDAPPSVNLAEQFDGGQPVSHPYEGTIPDLSAWHTYDLEVSFASGGAYSLKIDNIPTDGGLTPGWTPGPTRLLVSAGVYSPAKDAVEEHVHLDNVVLYTTAP